MWRERVEIPASRGGDGRGHGFGQVCGREPRSSSRKSPSQPLSRPWFSPPGGTLHRQCDAHILNRIFTSSAWADSYTSSFAAPRSSCMHPLSVSLYLSVSLFEQLPLSVGLHTASQIISRHTHCALTALPRSLSPTLPLLTRPPHQGRRYSSTASSSTATASSGSSPRRTPAWLLVTAPGPCCTRFSSLGVRFLRRGWSTQWCVSLAHARPSSTPAIAKQQLPRPLCVLSHPLGTLNFVLISRCPNHAARRLRIEHDPDD